MRAIFWNINGKAVEERVAKLAATAPAVDILALAESKVAPLKVISALSAAGLGQFQYAAGRACKRLQVFLRPNLIVRAPVLEGAYFSVRRIEEFSQPVLLAFLHLPSKLRYSRKTQELVAGDLAQQCDRVERRYPKHHLVVMGDFNMQPYEHGMIGADRFHAVNDRRIAAGIARKVAGKSYKMFYNPCWRHLGDTVKRPGGTFYRRSSDADCVFWLMLDQVLVRPGMLPYIDDTCVSIPDLIDGVSIRKGMAMRPNDAVSDHLPLLFVSSV